MSDGAAAFLDCVSIFRPPKAAYFAAALFFDSFRQPFPVPRDAAGLAIPTPVANWYQYVALYRWPSGLVETVGFCNWIRYNDAYLEGGLCVRAGFYRRLPKSHWKECADAGGIAELIMRTAERELNDCAAWFGFVGDKKSAIVTGRVGYEGTPFKHLIVKWIQETTETERERLIATIGAIWAILT